MNVIDGDYGDASRMLCVSTHLVLRVWAFDLCKLITAHTVFSVHRGIPPCNSKRV